MSNPKILDDLAELAGGAIGVLSSLKQQLRDETRDRVDGFANRLDLVTRAEFDRLEGMIVKARKVQDDILKRLDALEGKKTPSKAAPAAAKTSKAKKTATAKPKKKK